MLGAILKCLQIEDNSIGDFCVAKNVFRNIMKSESIYVIYTYNM